MMKSDGQKLVKSNGLIRGFSTYLRIVSSGASSVASTVRSAGASVASSIADRIDDTSSDQVRWAGFDKLEFEDRTRQVLLLCYQSGFQVWDVEEADNVHELVSRHDGPVSVIRVLQKAISSQKSEDKFSDARPLLAVAGNALISGGDGIQNVSKLDEEGNEDSMPTVVRFYSLNSHSYVHVLKFRSAVYSVRCSSRIVAISQEAQIHCFNPLTLEREYTILTYPITSDSLGSGGYGPLALGPRWLAHTGSPVVVSNTIRVIPQHTAHTSGVSGFTNRSMIACYAKQSSKQLVSGILSLGDMGYQRLYRYYSEVRPDYNSSPSLGVASFKRNGIVHSHLPDSVSVGMVIVRDMVSKSVIAQFRAHNSPISALCFDPSGTLLVTASIRGHNINVFRITPSSLSGSDLDGSCTHLYRLKRGITDAVIQDISFSCDSQLIMISSSKGTSHLFQISPSAGTKALQSNGAPNTGPTTKFEVNGSPGTRAENLNQQCLSSPASLGILSAICRIRNGSSVWRGTIGGAAAAAATGKFSSFSGAIASSFHNCNCNDICQTDSASGMKYHILIFSPTGCVIQYVLRLPNGPDFGLLGSELLTALESGIEFDKKLAVEPLQKWDICQKQNRREREDNVDVYGEHGNVSSRKVFPEVTMGKSTYHTDRGGLLKTKTSFEENHSYISESETQTHHSQSPLWAKSQIYFQSIRMDDIEVESLSLSAGEILIERFDTNTIKARSKRLVPVPGYLQGPGIQQSRETSLDSISSRLLQHQESAIYKDEMLSNRSNGSSFEGNLEDDNSTARENQNTPTENNVCGFTNPTSLAAGFVNKNDNPDITTPHKFVNNREIKERESHLKAVNNKEDHEH